MTTAYALFYMIRQSLRMGYAGASPIVFRPTANAVDVAQCRSALELFELHLRGCPQVLTGDPEQLDAPESMKVEYYLCSALSALYAYRWLMADASRFAVEALPAPQRPFVQETLSHLANLHLSKLQVSHPGASFAWNKTQMTATINAGHAQLDAAGTLHVGCGDTGSRDYPHLGAMFYAFSATLQRIVKAAAVSLSPAFATQDDIGGALHVLDEEESRAAAACRRLVSLLPAEDAELLRRNPSVFQQVLNA